jgi:hypothetical protein
LVPRPGIPISPPGPPSLGATDISNGPIPGTSSTEPARATSTTLPGDDPPEEQPGMSPIDGTRGCRSPRVASPPGCSNTSAAVVPFDEQGEDLRLAESMVATRRHDRSQSALGRPPVHRSRIHPEHHGDLPGAEQPINAAVRGHCHAHPSWGREVSTTQVTPGGSPCQTQAFHCRLR